MKRFLPFLAMFFGSLCFGLLFIGIFMNSTELDCARQGNSYDCRFRTMFFGKYQIMERNVDDIVDIKMEDSTSEGSTSYRAEFVTASGEQEPLSVVWTDYDPVRAQVDTIGAQIDAGSPTITYTSNPPWWVLYLIGGLTVMSMLMSFFFLRRN
jgi:hypothetical protein